MCFVYVYAHTQNMDVYEGSVQKLDQLPQLLNSHLHRYKLVDSPSCSDPDCGGTT